MNNKLASFFIYSIILLFFTSFVAITIAATYSLDKPLAMVRRFKPEVVIKVSQQNGWVNAQRAQQLFSSDTLRTGDDGHAVVQFLDNSIARLKPNTELVVTGESNSANSTSARIAVDIGEILLNVTGQQSTYEVATPSAVAAVKGTSFVSQINPDGSSTFTGLTGTVEITAINSGQQVNIGHRDRAMVEFTGNEIELTRVTEDEVNDFEEEYEGEFDETETPNIIKLRFRNSDGQVREVEIEYFEND